MFLAIDGLDESDISSRKDLLDTFEALLEKIDYLWIFVSSRPDGDIMDKLPSSNTRMSVDTSKTSSHTGRVVDTQLEYARTSAKPPPADKVVRNNHILCEKLLVAPY